MSWTFQLVNGTAGSLDLNDGTFYSVNVNGFHAPPPPRLTSYAGNNLFRHGAELIERTYGNRTVTMGLTVQATNASTLGQRVQDVWDYLRKAEEFSKDGLGTQIQLRYQWEGATGTYLFDLIEGNLDLGQGLHSTYLLKGTMVRSAGLTFQAKPFVTQDAETLSNYNKHPRFYLAASPLSDWVVQGTGTALRTTAYAYGSMGTASLEIRCTANFKLVNQTVVLATAYTGSVVATAWIRPEVVPGDNVRMRLYVSNTAGGALATLQNLVGTSGTTWVNQVITGSYGDIGTLKVELGAVGVTGSNVFQYAHLYLSTGTAPKAWVSGRDVANHNDDNGQAHINYLDIYGVPGDVPAPIQIKALESGGQHDLWVGARHDARLGATGVWIEGEAFTSTLGGGTGWAGTLTSAGFSNGSAGTGSATSTTPASPDVIMYNIATPPVGQFRVMARMHKGGSAGTGYAGIGYQYGGRTVDPSGTMDYLFTGTSTSYFSWHDLGVITIPPFQSPVGGTVGTLGLRIGYYASGPAQEFQIDAVHLMPIDYGEVYANKPSGTDNLWVDSRSQPEGVYLVSTAGVMQSFPANQVGSPPLAHTKGSRYYFVSGSAGTIGGSAISDGWTVSVTYTPRFLHVGT